MNKEIPFYKFNRAVRFKKTEIELWFEERKAAVAKIQNGKPDNANAGYSNLECVQRTQGGLFGGAEVAAGGNADGETEAGGNGMKQSFIFGFTVRLFNRTKQKLV